MSTHEEQESWSQKAGGAIWGLSLVFCSMEMVPGWGMFKLNWPASTYYGIMFFAGAAAGGLIAEKHRLCGLIGGSVGSPCSLLAISLVLERTTWTHTIILMVVGLLGALPGFLVYHACVFVEQSFLPPPTMPPGDVE